MDTRLEKRYLPCLRTYQNRGREKKGAGRDGEEARKRQNRKEGKEGGREGSREENRKKINLSQ